jgi:ADP-ribose pyrophosphatase
VPTPERPDPGTGFSKTGEATLVQGRVFDVLRAQFADPSGQPFERFVVRHPGAVAVVALDDEGRVHLVRQYRASLEREVLELPAGTCDVDGEDRLTTARRELAEEVGLEARHWEVLAAVRNSPGYSDQLTTIFLATGLSACPTGRGGVEERWMTVETLPLEGAAEHLETEADLDETTLLGLLLARAASRRG